MGNNLPTRQHVPKLTITVDSINTFFKEGTKAKISVPLYTSSYAPSSPFWPYETDDSRYNHSITFGDGHLYPPGHPYEGQFMGVNTWISWHLIPTSRPTVAQAGYSTNFVEIPGRKMGPIDLSDYLTGGPLYTSRSGSFEFIVANDYEYWEDLRVKIVKFLHGKTMKMCLADDPNYCYAGKFTFNEWRSESWNSKVVINYAVSPYKMPITVDELWKWDPFNFDEDQTDYSIYGVL